MNIFALHPDPRVSASMHCDQHLHKMILESAQMLSTWIHLSGYHSAKPLVYKPSYENHPCTKWIRAHPYNRWWLIQLCRQLESIRDSLNHPPHSSSEIIEVCADYIGYDEFPQIPYPSPTDWVFAGPLQFSLRPDLTIHEKYQAYYKHKYRSWLDTHQSMSYKGRPLPAFLREFATTIPHSSSQPYIE